MGDFELEPWEVPPGVEVGDAESFVTFGPVEFRGVSMRLRLRLVALSNGLNLAFVRPQQSQTNYVLMRESEELPLVFEAHITQTRAARLTSEQLPWAFGQLFYVEERLCVLREGRGFWLSPDWDVGHVTEFRAATSRASEHLSFSLWQWLQSELIKPNSETRYAWQWHGWSEEDKFRALGKHVRGWCELHELMRWISQLEGLPEGEFWWQDHIYLPDYPAIEKRLELWSNVLHPRFRGFRPLSKKVPLCLLKYSEMRLEHPRVEGQATSAHERLEARLQLREWLERNAPDQIETLLP